MTGFRFDPRRLDRPAKQLEDDGCAVAAEMLRDYLGEGDIFAEVRERVRRDPQLRAKFLAASEMLTRPAGGEGPERVLRFRGRRGRQA